MEREREKGREGGRGGGKVEQKGVSWYLLVTRVISSFENDWPTGRVTRAICLTVFLEENKEKMCSNSAR